MRSKVIVEREGHARIDEVSISQEIEFYFGMIPEGRHSIGCQKDKWYKHSTQILCKSRKRNRRLERNR